MPPFKHSVPCYGSSQMLYLLLSTAHCLFPSSSFSLQDGERVFLISLPLFLPPSNQNDLITSPLPSCSRLSSYLCPFSGKLTPHLKYLEHGHSSLNLNLKAIFSVKFLLPPHSPHSSCRVLLLSCPQYSTRTFP